jgi:hypothetical protein
MDTSNFPASAEMSEPPRRRDSRNLIIGFLAVGLLITVGYGLFHGSAQKQIQQSQQTQIAMAVDDKGKLQHEFDNSLVRLDSLTGTNNKVQSMLAERQNDISKYKNQIRKILKKESLTEAQKKEAETLIAQLNDKISNMEQEVARLTQSNQGLTQDNQQLTADKNMLTSDLQTTSTEKDELAKKADVASTLNASNIVIEGIQDKKNGEEKVTDKVKKVNELKLSFDVTNRITQNGQTDVYVCITGPDGKMVLDSAKGSGTFTSREDGDKMFTAKVPVEFESGKVIPVKFAWKQNNVFEPGAYKIEIYHNGYKIGEGVKELKKGGLFS